MRWKKWLVVAGGKPIFVKALLLEGFLLSIGAFLTPYQSCFHGGQGSDGAATTTTTEPLEKSGELAGIGMTMAHVAAQKSTQGD